MTVINRPKLLNRTNVKSLDVAQAYAGVRIVFENPLRQPNMEKWIALFVRMRSPAWMNDSIIAPTAECCSVVSEILGLQGALLL
jgi:hypothetical protein